MRFTNEIRNKLLQEKGIQCCNCQKNCEDIVFHHIVPLSLGGSENFSNIVPLCNNCHNLIHHGKNNNHYTHSELIKEGMKKAKENGVAIGRKTTTIEDIPSNFKNEYYPLIKNKQISITEVARQLKMSRTTIYKYIGIIENI